MLSKGCSPCTLCISNSCREGEIVQCVERPLTKLYTVLGPVPSELASADLKVTARCEVNGPDHIEDAHASVQFSLIRSRSTTAKQDTIATVFDSVQHEKPEDYVANCQRLGWDFVPLDENHMTTVLSVATVSVTNEWQDIAFTLQSDAMDELLPSSGALAHAVEGDRPVIWAISNTPGVTLHLKEAKITFMVQGFHASDNTTSSDDVADSSGPAKDPSWIRRDKEEDSTNPHHDDNDEKDCLYHDDSGNQDLPKTSDEKTVACPCGDCGRSIVMAHLQALYPGDWTMVPCQGSPRFDPLSIKSATNVSSCDQSSTNVLHRAVSNPCSHYAPSRAGENLIRLLQISPLAKGEDIEVIVHTFDRRELAAKLAADGSGYPYVALSYCWGDLDKTRRISLTHVYQKPDRKRKTPGVCYRHPFNITENLHAALRRLRDTCEPILFWIDALCIDQNNIDERNSQVGTIAEVYRQATGVFMWLGAPSHIVQPVHDCLSRMAFALKRQYGDSFDPYDYKSEYAKFYVQSHVPTCTTCYTAGEPAFDQYFSLPWFRRIWVVQEIFQANANVTVLPPSGRMVHFQSLAMGMGYQQLKMMIAGGDPTRLAPDLWLNLCSRLTKPSHRLSVTPYKQGELVSMATPQKMPTSLGSEDRLDVLHLFQQGFQFDSTDPKDKIYAILGLARDLAEPSKWPRLITPDYSKTDAEVYVNFTRFCIQRSQTLEALSVASTGARADLVGTNSPVVPLGYPFPPKRYPSWALWHAQKRRWMLPPRREKPKYNYLSCTAGLFTNVAAPGEGTSRPFCLPQVDVALVGDDVDIKELRLRGTQLDEIDVVFPVCLTHDGRAIIGDATDSVPFGIQELWNMILIDHRRSAASVGTPGAAHDNRQAEASLFHDLLLTLICEQYTASHDPSGGSRVYQGTNFDRADPFNSSIMHNFVPYWLSLQHGTFPPSRKKQTELLRNPLPPLQIAGLPELVAEAWQAVLAELSQSSSEELQMHITISDAGYLHHTPGQWYFRSKAGRIGMCPYGTRSGDLLVALRGAIHASVLRADEDVVDEDSAHGCAWIFVGEAKVNRWLNGQFGMDLGLGDDYQDGIWTLV